MKERLKIRHKNEKIENHEKQRLATLKRLKRGDNNELKRSLKWSLANSSGWPWRQKKKEQELMENDAEKLANMLSIVLTT